MKKFVLVILMHVSILTCFVSINVVALDKAGIYGDFEYYWEDDGIAIAKYWGVETKVTIPDNFDGIPVVCIYDLAFEDCSSVTSVYIPASVIRYGQHIFLGCSSLTSILGEVGSTAESIAASENLQFNNAPLNNINSDFAWTLFDGQARVYQYNGNNSDVIVPAYINAYPVQIVADTTFSKNADGTNPEIKSVTISEGITSIDMCCFSGLEQLQSVSLPSTIKEIPEQCFEGCTSLKEIVLPEGVESILGYAFSDCGNLDITLPDSITYISPDAFYGTSYVIHFGSNLYIQAWLNDNSTTARVDPLPQNPQANEAKLKSHISVKCNELSGTASIVQYEGNRRLLLIPDSYTDNQTGKVYPITGIDNSAFANNAFIEAVYIPDSITRISDYAFADCYNLQYVRIPSNLGRISLNSFYRTTSTSEDSTALQWISLYGETSSIQDAISEYISKCVDNSTVGYCYLSPADSSCVFFEDYLIRISKANQDVIYAVYYGDSEKVLFSSIVHGYKIYNLIIENNAFLVNAVLPSDVPAFIVTGCNNLETISLSSDSCRSLIIENCDKLSDISFSQLHSDVHVEEFALSLSGCSSITNLRVPCCALSLALGVSDLTSLEEIDIADGTKTISYLYIDECANLKKVVVPESVSYVDTVVLLQGCPDLNVHGKHLRIRKPYSSSNNELLIKLNQPDARVVLSVAFILCLGLAGIFIPIYIKKKRGRRKE